MYILSYSDWHSDYYEMVNSQNQVINSNYITKEKAIPVEDVCGVFYTRRTEYNTSDPNIQVAYRYVDPMGSEWELGGQPYLELNNNVLNIYADKQNDNRPILIIPAKQDENKSYLSDWWSVDGLVIPTGYPAYGEQQPDFALSYAMVTAQLDQFTTLDKTYTDVIAVFWMHGSKTATPGVYPGGEDTLPIAWPKNNIDRGYNVYGGYYYYAKNVGLIAEQLLWYYSPYTGETYGYYSGNGDGWAYRKG